MSDPDIKVTIDLEDGDPNCDHHFLKSELLLVQRCEKCGRTESL